MCNLDEMHSEDAESMVSLIEQLEAQEKAWAEAEASAKAKPVPLIVVAE